MKKETYRVCGDHVVWRLIDDEAVVLNLEKDEYFSFNEVGTRIWALLERGHAVPRIADTICREYGAGRKTVLADLRDIIALLLKEDLIARR